MMHRSSAKRRSFTVISLLLAAASFANAQPVTIAGKEYKKLATRAETRDAILKQIAGAAPAWSDWHVVAPFANPSGAKNTANAHAPEQLLAAMKPGAAEPDFSQKFKDGAKELAWRPVTQKQDIGGLGGLRPIDLRDGIPQNERTNVDGYLYRSIVVDKPTDLPISVGSDDGLRLWLNGELLVDDTGEHPLDPGAHQLILKLQPGRNHLLAKVTQGGGEWEFQLTQRIDMDPQTEAELEYQLDADFPDEESRFYRVITIPVPLGIEAEVGGLDVYPAPDSRPILCTRRGDVYTVEGAYNTPPTGVRWTRFATGLQEPLGISLRPDPDHKGQFAAFTAQRSELTRLRDLNADGVADEFTTICADWKISGNYHEYAFGPKFDAAGNAWITLNLAHTGGETVMGTTIPTRGCAVRVAPDGTMTKVVDGLRSPDGIGMWSDGQMFYTDNQGDYVGTNKLSPLFENSFQGHQASLKFRDGYGPNWKKDGKPVPEITPPAVWFPYQKMGQSASDILLDQTKGKFGPFSGQLFIGDQTHATVMRVFLERYEPATPNGHPIYQGACFPFRKSFESGVHRLAFGTDGSMFVGMTDRGWGSTGPKRFGLQRVVWTGQMPFEILEMRAAPDGFNLVFTKQVDPATASNPASYSMSSYTYEYHPDYGSAEMQSAAQKIESATLVNPTEVHLKIATLRTGFVHELHAPGVHAAGGSKLLHDTAYYTLQHIPSK